MISQEQFLKVFFEESLQQGKYIETRDILPGGVIQEFHTTIEGVINYAPKGNYFFGVCPREIKDGTEAGVKVINSFWVDIDVTFELAMDRLKSFPKKPSIVISSGHGAHVYWLLKELEPIKSNTKGVLKGLSLALDGDKCFDLPRILRIPGTKNLKYPNNPKDVQVIIFEPDVRYNLSDFDSYEVEIQKKSEVSVSFSCSTQEIDLDNFKISDSIKDLILNGKQDEDKYRTRSEADFAVVCALVKANCSDDTIKAIFERYPIGKKYKEQGEGYLKHTINKAKEATEEKRPLPPSVDLRSLSDGPIRFNSHRVIEVLSTNRRLIYCAGTFYEYRDGCYREVDDEIVKLWVMDLVGPSLSKKAAEEIIFFLRPRVFVDVRDLNNTDYLNVKNGLLDLDTWKLIPHSPDIYSTIQLDVGLNPSAKCEKWLKTLKEIFPFEGEDEKISDLQEFLGLCFTKTVKYSKALLCVGEGANGKSLILNVMAKILGKDNISAIPLEKFDNTHYLVNLFGKLVNISIETNAKSEVYDSMFKAVVTGDLIQADQKFKPSFHFNPFCKLIFATNNLPRVDDKTDAFFRRVLIIRFNKQFTEEEQNKNLSGELLEESEGILIWCLEGLKRLNARGHFKVKDYMQKEIDEYRKENNSVIVFVEEICVLGVKEGLLKKDLYDIYRKWCESNGFSPLKKIKFGKELVRQFKTITDERGTNGERLWIGIKVNDDWYNEILVNIAEPYKSSDYRNR